MTLVCIIRPSNAKKSSVLFVKRDGTVALLAGILEG